MNLFLRNLKQIIKLPPLVMTFTVFVPYFSSFCFLTGGGLTDFAVFLVFPTEDVCFFVNFTGIFVFTTFGGVFLVTGFLVAGVVVTLVAFLTVFGTTTFDFDLLRDVEDVDFYLTATVFFSALPFAFATTFLLAIFDKYLDILLIIRQIFFNYFILFYLILFLI